MPSLSELLGQDFSFDNVEVVNQGTIPEGEYVVTASSIEVKPTSSGTGMRMSIRFVVEDDGPYRGRSIFMQYNVVNQSKQAENIAQQQLKQFVLATGVDEKQVEAEIYSILHIPIRARVAIEQGRNGYDDRNKITRYKPYSDYGAPQAPANPPPSAPRPAAPQQSASADKPWLRK